MDRTPSKTRAALWMSGWLALMLIVAVAALFLADPENTYMNGHVLVVDGGWSSTKYLSDFALSAEWVAR